MKGHNGWEKVIEGVRNQNVRSLARMITRVENRENGWKQAMKTIYPETGKARVIGITGSPGAGKSTLTCEIAREFLNQGLQVGIIAVDPTSPFSGGAILGDRLRMKELFTHENVFIRSMATRGMLGGLCQGARDVVRILDAFGKDIVLIETVGVGQDEIEVVRTADLVMVVLVPGQGDNIQAIKAGVMEIADLYVVNKSDREGADQVVSDVMAMLDLSTREGAKPPPVVKVSALKRTGIKELEALLLQMSGSRKDQNRSASLVKEEILSLLEREIFSIVRKTWEKNGQFEEAVASVVSRSNDPYSIVETLMEKTGGPWVSGIQKES